MKVRLSAEARLDLTRIGNHIAQDSPLRARAFLRRLRESALNIGDTPLAFPLVPHFEYQGLRRRVYRDYLIFYQVVGDIVHIVHVLHGARDYDLLLYPDHDEH